MGTVGGKVGGTGTNQREREDDVQSREGGESMISEDQYKEENPKVMKATL